MTQTTGSGTAHNAEEPPNFALMPFVGGHMGAAIREHDWNGSPLGLPETWPAPLRMSVSLMLGSAFPMFVAWGPDLGFIYNDAYAEILGDKHPRALGQRFQDIWREIWPDIEPLIRRALSGKSTWSENLPLLMRRHGYDEQTWFTFSYSPLRDEAGQVAGMFCACTETTGQVVAEERLRESETRFRNMADNAPVMMWITDTEGTCTYLNRLWYSYTGQTETEGLGLGWLDAVHPDDRGWSSDTFLTANAKREAFRLEYRLKGANGEYRWFIDAAQPRLGDDGSFHGYIGSVTDIHDRKTAEQRLLEFNTTLEQRAEDEITRRVTAEEALRQSQKMEAVGQLTGGLAHDFNNLLAGISGSLELMHTRLQQGRHGDVERYMAAAQGATKRAAALTHRLLAFSRRQTLDPKPTSVNRLVADMQELIQRTVGPSILVEVVGASGLWPALVDPSQLENALLNLCINARDAMPNGGRITIETANKWLDWPSAAKHDIPEGQYLSLCVTDTGTGMPPEIIERVFEPFFTTKPIGEGTGLGLSMIYGFAQQSGGSSTHLFRGRSWHDRLHLHTSPPRRSDRACQP